MAAIFVWPVHDDLMSDRVSSRQRIMRTRSGRLVHQVRHLSARIPGCQVYTVRAEAVGDGPIVTLTLLERGLDGPVAA